MQLIRKMRKTIILLYILGISYQALAQKPLPKPNAATAAEKFQVVPKPDSGKVDILIEGKLFTSYIYRHEKLKKPVLYPIISATGQKITRRFPLEKAAGERFDTPSEVGLWFAFGNVNGLDFWNNSYRTTEKEAPKMGTIQHAKILKTKNGADACGLEVSAQWQRPDGSPVLFQNTKYVFREQGNTRMIDIVVTISALDEKVNLEDDANGLLGLRVCRELEMPVNDKVMRTDANGSPGLEPTANKAGISGNYLSNETFMGEQVKGQKARWVKLSGKIKNESVDVILLDHPSNVPHPPYWDVSAGGLFAINPLGAKVYTNGEKYLGMEIPAGNSAIYRYRLIVQAKGGFTPALIEAEFEKFAKLK